MWVRWWILLIPPLIVGFALVAASQFVFLRASLFEDLGLGRTGDELLIDNYVSFLTDGFYLRILWVTVKTSALAALSTLILGFPVAYLIARMRSSWSMILLAGIVVSTFITIVIKVYGLIVIFSADGLFNQTMLGLGLFNTPYSVFGNESGIVIGLMHFTLGFGVLLLYSIIQTIPSSLESAAQIHGASRWRVYYRVIFPLSLPGITAMLLMVFNMCMGAFTSAALLGGGKVFTLPVMIQRSVMMDIKYSMGATIAAVLLVSVIAINILSIYLLRRLRAAHLVMV